MIYLGGSLSGLAQTTFFIATACASICYPSGLSRGVALFSALVATSGREIPLWKRGVCIAGAIAWDCIGAPPSLSEGLRGRVTAPSARLIGLQIAVVSGVALYINLRDNWRVFVKLKYEQLKTDPEALNNIPEAEFVEWINAFDRHVSSLDLDLILSKQYSGNFKYLEGCSESVLKRLSYRLLYRELICEIPALQSEESKGDILILEKIMVIWQCLSDIGFKSAIEQLICSSEGVKLYCQMNKWVFLASEGDFDKEYFQKFLTQFFPCYLWWQKWKEPYASWAFARLGHKRKYVVDRLRETLNRFPTQVAIGIKEKMKKANPQLFKEFFKEQRIRSSGYLTGGRLGNYTDDYGGAIVQRISYGNQAYACSFRRGIVEEN